MPASILQTYAYLLSESTSRLTLLSISLSILSTAYGTVIICFDFDLNPSYRFTAPEFYCFIPSNSSKRFVVFISMFLFSASHITMKVIGVTILATISATYRLVFLASDMMFFFAYKCVRGDFRWERYNWKRDLNVAYRRYSYELENNTETNVVSKKSLALLHYPILTLHHIFFLNEMP